jgi:hypothetical protein
MSHRESSETKLVSGVNRRAFLEVTGGAAALGILGYPHSVSARGWDQEHLMHLIPGASHERFLIKASFKAPMAETPRLSVDGKPINGEQTDTEGRFWRFDVRSLRPATQYALQITDSGGCAPLR